MEVETGKVQHSRNEHGHGAQISLYVLHFFFATLAHTCTHMHTSSTTDRTGMWQHTANVMNSSFRLVHLPMLTCI